MYGYRRRRDCMDGENWTKPQPFAKTQITTQQPGSSQRCRFAIPAEDMRKSFNSDFANIQEVVFVSLLPIPGIS